MKNYNIKLESSTKNRKIGTVTFVYDKAFRGKFDSYTKFVPFKMSMFIYHNQTVEGVRADVIKRYKNAREIEIVLEK